MKYYTLVIASLALGARLLASKQPAELQMKWGLENEKYFRETNEIDTSQTSREVTKQRPRTYRFFTTGDAYERIIMRVFERHHSVWSSFKPTGVDLAEKKAEFSAFLAARDPLLQGWIRDLAPRLYFDFLGASGQEYVLESISVKTISFDEYKGGGFTEKEAWYDIELSHTTGMKTYPVEGKLRFEGSGRAVLRFWSDNYYESMGMSPMGCYTIDLTFNFLVNGKRRSISTGPFKLDC